MQFTIPGHLPALNEIINSSKTHWSVYRKERNKAIHQVRDAIFKADLSPISAKVRLSIAYWCPDRRKDPDNISAGARKIILDALQRYGILNNDGYHNIGGFSERFFVDKDHPRIEVELIEVAI